MSLQKLYFIARFHIYAARAREFVDAIAEVSARTRAESGCLSFTAFRSLDDYSMFFIHSVWRDEQAFEEHAILPHTLAFLAHAQQLVDQPIETSRLAKMPCQA